MDIIGPVTKAKDGSRYILLIVDSYSKWCEAFPLKTTESEVIAKILYSEIICRYGAPEVLVTDRGQNFISSLIKEICKYFQITKVQTSSYHPQTNATCERMNSVIEQSLRAYCEPDQKNWPELLPSIMFSYRVTPATQSTHYTPYFLLFGRECRLPIDTAFTPSDTLPERYKTHVAKLLNQQQVFRDEALNNTREHQRRYKEVHDRKAKDPGYCLGDQVWLYCTKTQPGLSPKLCRKWLGPYYIVEKPGMYTYKLRRSLDNKILRSTVHANRLKHYFSPDEIPTNPPKDMEKLLHEYNPEEYDELQPNRVNNQTQQEEQPPSKQQSQQRVNPLVGKSIKKVAQKKGKYYKVLFTDHPSLWISEEFLPPELIRDFHIHFTHKGKRKKFPQQVNTFNQW
jgi:hypothetical protein